MSQGLRRMFTLVAVFVAAFLAVYVIRNGPEGLRKLFVRPPEGPEFRPEAFTLPQKPALELADVELLTRLNDEYSKLTDAVAPAVVSIDTSGVRAQRLLDGMGRQMIRRVPTTGQGSGVIVSLEGHVVTNDHVVNSQQQIQITLKDGTTYPATMIGEDPLLDIAVLKIEGQGPFTPLKFGDSTEVRQGQIVFAFGNPFGLGETVTQGIISAVERSVSDIQRDLFQTDAAINPGNSGGPLVNLRGEIIGINSAIYRPDERVNSGFQGVGFSIPSNDVVDTLKTILERGRPVRGYLGLRMFPDPRVKSLLGYQGDGVAISSVTPGSPADRAGLLARDVVVRYDGEVIDSLVEMIALVQRTKVGREVPIQVWRDGEELTVTARIVESPSYDAAGQPEEGQDSDPFTDRQRILQAVGIAVADLTPTQRQAGFQGVIVTGVARGGLAEGKVRSGDLIVTVNQTQIDRAKIFQDHLAAAVATGPTVLYLIRNGQPVRVELEALPPRQEANRGPENPPRSTIDPE